MEKMSETVQEIIRILERRPELAMPALMIVFDEAQALGIPVETDLQSAQP